MSFISHMVTSLKNNKRQRPSALTKIKNFEKVNNIKVVFKNNASNYKLKKIKEKIQRENKIKMQKNIIILFIVMLVIIYVIGFVKF